MLRSPGVPNVLERSHQVETRHPACLVPVVVKAELLSLALRRGWQVSQDIEALLRRYTLVDISRAEVIEAYVSIDQHNARLGRKMGKNDLWVAAVTHSVGGTLLTTDADFNHLHPAIITVDHITQQALFAAAALP